MARIAAGEVAEGAAVRMVGYRYPALPLRVNTAGIDSASAAALTGALGANPMVQLVPEQDAFSHLLVRRRGEELRVVGADGFVRHGGIDPGDGEALAVLLREEAGAKRLADMENPARPFEVEVRLEADKTSFGIGEKVSFHATSPSPRPTWASSSRSSRPWGEGWSGPS